VLLAFAVGLISASALAQENTQAETSAQINYSGFRDLTREVEAYRENRLVTLADFQRMAREPNTIVLDARSAGAYADGHIDGAINLPFTDFTDQSLSGALRDPNVRILIYCNNNFSNNAQPVVLKRVELACIQTSSTLRLQLSQRV
jgi:3-mercaptopyruvate sulfurtransferase SseA